MSKFAQLKGQSVVVESTLQDIQPAEEGWVTSLSRAATIIASGVAGSGLGSSIADKFNVSDSMRNVLSDVGTLLGFLGGRYIHDIFYTKNGKKIIENPKFREHVIKEADACFKAAKKQDSSVIYDMDTRKIKVALNQITIDGEPGGVTNALWQATFRDAFEKRVKIGKYTIIVLGDEKKLNKIAVAFWSTKREKVILYGIKAPTVEEIDEMFKSENK